MLSMRPIGDSLGKGVPSSLGAPPLEVVPTPKVIPVCMPSFLFVELSCCHLRNLQYHPVKLILTPNMFAKRV